MHTRFHILATQLVLSLVLVGAVHAQNAAKAEPGEITSFDQVISVVPRDQIVNLRNAAKKDAAIISATDILRTKIEGKPATMKFTVERVEKYQDREDKSDRYRIRAVEAKLRESGTYLNGILWVVLEPSENSKVPLIKAGKILSITGKITSAAINVPNTPEVRLEVSHAKIQ